MTQKPSFDAHLIHDDAKHYLELCAYQHALIFDKTNQV